MNGPERGIIVARNGRGAEKILSQVGGKSPLFLCVGGTTETAKIPGLSMAGKNPEFTDYTPTADLEIITHGRPKSIGEVPATPQGIPTPAILTLSALQLGEIPSMGVNSGMKVRPKVPAVDVGGEPGESMREEKAVKDPREAFDNARSVGDTLGKMAEYVVIGETVPGGTTTALGVLEAMGVEAEGKLSSSMPQNPHELKSEVVGEGLKVSGLESGGLENDPLKAISLMGDPMMPAAAGLAAGSARHGPVMLAGGTQMVAVLKVLEVIGGEAMENLCLGTTRWIVQDKESDINGLTAQAADVPILAADLDFSESKFDGLRAYEGGYVKEGVGAGGAAVAAMAKSRSIDAPSLSEKTEENYEKLVR